MPRLSASLTTLVLSAPMLALIGCGGAADPKPAAGTQGSSKPAGSGASAGGGMGSSASTETTNVKPPEQDAAQDKPKGNKAPGESVTPNSGINTQAVVDVVKEEVKGGEATEGPTPLAYLWLPTRTEAVKDEPMTVEVPLGLNGLIPNAVVPASNPLTKGKVELGKQLYFDPRVSKDGTVSCATCHDPAKGWTDQLPTSAGIGGQIGGRNAPTVINTAYGRSMFWDGRAPSLEGQAQGPIQNKIEMGDQSYKEIVERLRNIPGYTEEFQRVFGTDVTLDGMAKAIASFERVAALSGNSPFDKYNTGNDLKALDEGQKRGLVLFGLSLNGQDDFKTDAVRGKAKCTTCHSGFNFTDERFHNIGVGWLAKDGKFADPGRFGVAPIGAKNFAEYGAFKTPTIRDIVNTAPYMHDGAEKTLEAVVDYYDKGGNANPTLDPEMKKLDLTAQEKKDLVAFMKALTGETRKVELPKLPPGKDGKAPNPADALATPTAKTALNAFHPGATR